MVVEEIALALGAALTPSAIKTIKEPDEVLDAINQNDPRRSVDDHTVESIRTIGHAIQALLKQEPTADTLSFDQAAGTVSVGRGGQSVASSQVSVHEGTVINVASLKTGKWGKFSVSGYHPDGHYYTSAENALSVKYYHCSVKYYH